MTTISSPGGISLFIFGDDVQFKTCALEKAGKNIFDLWPSFYSSILQDITNSVLGSSPLALRGGGAECDGNARDFHANQFVKGSQSSDPQGKRPKTMFRQEKTTNITGARSWIFK